MIMCMPFLYAVTSLANKEFSGVAIMHVITGYIGIECLHAVDQTQTREKIKRAIDSRRFWRTVLWAEQIQ